MAKVKTKKKDNRIYIRVKLSKNEKLNEREFEFFRSKYVAGLIEGKMKKKNLLEYTSPVGQSVFERLLRPITKHEFFLIIEHAIEMERRVNESGLAMNKLDLDIKHIFISDYTKEMHFIYLPLEGAKGGAGIMRFIDEVIYSARPALEGEQDFVSRFVYFIRNLPSIDFDQIENYIYKEDRTVLKNEPKRIDRNGASTGQGNGQIYAATYGVQGQAVSISGQPNYAFQNGGYVERAGVLVGQNGGFVGQNTGYAGQIGRFAGQSANYSTNQPQNQVNGNDDTIYLDEGATGILDDESTGLLQEDDESTGLLASESRQVSYPKLYRVLTEETIVIDKAVFRVGKEKSYADYFVNNNSAVSRNHCDIIVRGNRYFVMDLNSKNRTFINNHVIPVRQETEIFNGDKLRLANEEFVFYTA